MFLTVLGFLIIIGFFFMETRLRRGDEAKSWKAGQSDQRSTMLIVWAYVICGVALVLTSLFDKVKGTAFPAWVGWIGILIALLGFGLRIWSMTVLGKFYTRTLKVTESQSIVQDGPYHLVRHPGYLSSILIWAGVATSAQNLITLLIVLLTMFSVYAYRIQAEEKMLLEANADYAEYRKHTWRLIPLVY